MKLLFATFLVLLRSIIVMSQSPGTIEDIRNHRINIDSFEHKRLLVVLLSAKTDTALQEQLLRFHTKQGSRIHIIGLIGPPAVNKAAGSVDQIYMSLLQSGIFVSRGFHSPGNPSSKIASLLRWVTAKSDNRSQEALAEGRKYFVSEAGKIYAVLGPESSLDLPIAGYIANTKIPEAKIH